MRVFIGIECPKSVKDSLELLKSKIEPFVVKGHFSRIENLHLTLVFIGEVTYAQIESLSLILDRVLENQNRFDLTLGDLGCFMKGQQSIVWMGIDQGKEYLFTLSKLLKNKLTKHRFDFDQKPIKPHVTLIRQATIISGYEFKEYDLHKSWHVDKIHLYLSHQVDGVLTYETLHTVYLK